MGGEHQSYSIGIILNYECLYFGPISAVDVEIFHWLSENIDMFVVMNEKSQVTKVIKTRPLETMNVDDFMAISSRHFTLNQSGGLTDNAILCLLMWMLPVLSWLTSLCELHFDTGK